MVTAYNGSMSYLQNAHAGAKLFLRSLQPSLFGLAFSVLCAIVVMGSHMLLLSVSGTAYPAAFDDILLQGYANYIVGPLSAAVNSNAVNLALLAFLWGTAGFLVYEGLAFVASLLYDWRTVRRSIAMPAERVIRKHPLERSFLSHLAWRLLVIFISLLLTIALLPVVQFNLTNVELLLDATSTAAFMQLLGVTILWWIIIIHCYVVLLRWYIFRTRLTGEILY
jgi:hypothetical protein